MKKRSEILETFMVIVMWFYCSLWSFWGIVENFHEGWYEKNIWLNIKIMLIQYLSIPLMLIFILLVSIYNRKIGAILFLVLWIASLSYVLFLGNIKFSLKRAVVWFFVLSPLLAYGTFLIFEGIKKKKRALIFWVVFPILLMIFIGGKRYIDVKGRFDDGNFGERIVYGNKVVLVWAKRGPGFPKKGGTWFKAYYTCSHLSLNGETILRERVNYWRLPTRDEIVRSLTKHNKNCGGEINNGKAYYKVKPDKETPLWDPHSIVIYYWTSEKKGNMAYLVAYNGRIILRSANNGADYHGFRCVRSFIKK